MSLEGFTTEQIEAYEAELLKHVPETGAIGNVSLNYALQWDESLYWDVRNRLIERGILVQGRGRGGSVRRLLVENAIPKTTVPETVCAQVVEEEIARESDLYQPMAEVIRN